MIDDVEKITCCMLIRVGNCDCYVLYPSMSYLCESLLFCYYYYYYYYYYIYIGYMMFSYSTCMIGACTGHACTFCTRIPISTYQYLTQLLMV